MTPSFTARSRSFLKSCSRVRITSVDFHVCRLGREGKCLGTYLRREGSSLGRRSEPSISSRSGAIDSGGGIAGIGGCEIDGSEGISRNGKREDEDIPVRERATAKSSGVGVSLRAPCMLNFT